MDVTYITQFIGRCPVDGRSDFYEVEVSAMQRLMRCVRGGRW